jgi:uncharacterized membrane protein YadS
MLAFSGMMLICYCLLETLQLSAMMLVFLVIGPTTLCGGAAVFAMSAYSYIADTTSSKNRTVRTGKLKT